MHVQHIAMAADIPGILAVPDSGHGPGVIVIQEWWGIVPHIRHVVERFAEAGFVALAVDHYRGVETTEPSEAKKLMLGLRLPSVAADLAGAAEHLLSREEVLGVGVGVVGFCMGGGLALLAPTVSPAIDRAVGFYPAMPWPDYAPDWSHYAGKSAVIHRAESDEPSTGAAIAEYAAAIRQHGGSIELYDYPGSSHAFFNDDRPEVYSADHARVAWDRTLDFLRR